MSSLITRSLFGWHFQPHQVVYAVIFMVGAFGPNQPGFCWSASPVFDPDPKPWPTQAQDGRPCAFHHLLSLGEVSIAGGTSTWRGPQKKPVLSWTSWTFTTLSWADFSFFLSFFQQY
jgi:hypothetical protein